ncbi:hypothetical protein OC709_02290 ['Planchonia careya' phytoplasma]|nr:hypothetical protein ['Planchonia careya' phytoplasma]MDO8030328.1 hypothetical protein ['Planchonia careya' phytoplasma]
MHELSNKNSRKLDGHGESTNPCELESIGKQILQKCGGAPLAISATAALPLPR